MSLIHPPLPPYRTCRLPPLPAADLEHVRLGTRELWPGTRGATFFITGGTGFFGCWLVESLLEISRSEDLGFRLIVLSRDPDGFLASSPHLADVKSLEFFRGDARTCVFPRREIDYVIHAAAGYGAGGSGAEELITSIIEGTRRVRNFATAAGARRGLFTSSGAIYGPQPPELDHLSEDYRGAPDPVHPGSAYGEAKRTAECLWCLPEPSASWTPVVARGFAFVGPRLPLDGAYAVGNFIRDALDGRSITITGDGRTRRSYLYAADLTVWLLTLLLRGRGGVAYNVGSALDVSLTEVAETVRRLHPGAGPVVSRRQSDPSKPVSRYVPAIDRAGREFGLREQIPLEEGLRRTLQWHRHLSQA